ncbi:MAG: alpha/beta hydrolase fold domain-containing protein [Solirubrobacterales bacterium]
MGPFVALLRRLAVLQRLGAPLRLHVQVWRWMVRLGVREFAFLYAAIDAVWLKLAASRRRLSAVIPAALLATEARYAWLAWRSARAVSDALADYPPSPEEVRFPRSHLAFPFLMLFSGSVERERGVVYHSEPRRRVRLDVYRPRRPAPAGTRRPAVIQVHGGGWIVGSRLEQGIPLLNHLAANGWVGFNIDYRLSPRATMPEHVIDVKRAIAWVRAHADELGVDPARIALTGGSAGGHLTALAALTADDESLQPGFEGADTSVAAAVPFYGVYDFTDPDQLYAPGIRDWLLSQVVIKRPLAEARELWEAFSPIHRVHAGAPPFLVFHGEEDSLVPIDDARAFVNRLAAVSDNPARLVELPGAEHAFDLFPSLRTARVVEGIERFLRATVKPPPEDPGTASSDRASIVSRA